MASISSVINAAGKVTDILFDLSPKTFYSTRDFYNFIKKRLNAPMMRKHFTVVPHCEIHVNKSGSAIPQVWNTIFNDNNLAKFAILIQGLEFPGRTFGMQEVPGSTSPPIITPYGQYSLQSNGYSGGRGHSVDINFLLTADPIILHMILPWYYECIRTFNAVRPLNRSDLQKLTDEVKDNLLGGAADALTSVADKFKMGEDSFLRSGSSWLKKQKGNYEDRAISEYPCPKLTIDIKYYRMDLIAGLLFLMNPTFVYRLTGVYPVNITPAEAKHQGYSDSSLVRKVTFNFNNFICIPNGAYLLQMYGNVRIGFPYKDMSPIQILNALNLTAQGALGAVDAIRNI